MKSLLVNLNRDRISGLLKTQALWAVLVVVIAVVWGMPPQDKAEIWPDSASYLGMSTQRMPVFPLIAGLLGYGVVFVWFHFLLSVAAWCWLGWVIARAVGVLIGACIAVSGPIIMWNLAVLSESICLSLLVALLAATVLLFRHWSWWRFGVWSLLALLFALTRTSNMFLLPFLAIPFIATNKKQLMCVLLAAVVVFTIADTYSRNRGKSLRHVSLVNVYTARLLRNDNSRQFLNDRGMPLTPEMEQFVNKTGRINARELFYTCPDFAEWFGEKGTSTYYLWLLTQPQNYSAPAVALEMNLDFLNLQYAERTQIRSLSYFMLYFYDKFLAPWWIWILGLFIPFINWRITGRISPESLFVPALMLGIYSQAYVGFHGDRAEISRHMLVALVMYRITLWLILASAVSVFLAWRQQQPAPASPSANRAAGTTGHSKKSRRKKS